MFKLHCLGCPVIRDVGPEHGSLDASLRQEVDNIWANAQAGRAKPLFNGQVFSVLEIGDDEIRGRFVEYKYFIAQRRRAELFPALQIRPLAITGILRAPGRIVFGRRAAGVTQEPGLWELLPSGGLDPGCRQGDGRLDVERQLLQELKEEIGLEAAAISKIRPFCIVEDLEQHVFDIAAELTTDSSDEQVRSAFEQSGSDEYDHIKIVPERELQRFLGEQASAMAPFSRYLLQLLEMHGRLPAS